MFNNRLRAFHIQFLHRAFHLNKVHAKYQNCSQLCIFCNNSDETYFHLFWECQFTQECWNNMIEFSHEYICASEDVMSHKNCLLSNFSSGLLVMITVFFKRGHIFMQN